ncbi:hypothetical protein GCM10014715_23530 [Streptomyces spiralis]|uniref:Uncharacterized protein n=1 Tax=Streptomyces spiralis TaxID=66376 RepID=A0A918ZUN6_9ACTN|nr:hypothetical protein GCM10014715_23530 [Streptomyces spiralis]
MVAMDLAAGRCSGYGTPGAVVAGLGPENVDAAAGEGDDGGDVLVALGPFREVVARLGPSRMMLVCAER